MKPVFKPPGPNKKGWLWDAAFGAAGSSSADSSSEENKNKETAGDDPDSSTTPNQGWLLKKVGLANASAQVAATKAVDDDLGSSTSSQDTLGLLVSTASAKKKGRIAVDDDEGGKDSTDSRSTGLSLTSSQYELLATPEILSQVSDHHDPASSTITDAPDNEQVDEDDQQKNAEPETNTESLKAQLPSTTTDDLFASQPSASVQEDETSPPEKIHAQPRFDPPAAKKKSAKSKVGKKSKSKVDKKSKALGTESLLEGINEVVEAVLSQEDESQSSDQPKPRRRKKAKQAKSVKRPSNDNDDQTSPSSKRTKSSDKLIDTRQALLELQKMRTANTWVMCTKPGCGKWRFINTKDPAEVKEDFTCSDNPDDKMNDCEAPEQSWDQSLSSRMVETQFTVGSLVWAKLEGWSAWPAMVDDDPDTGAFFWTEWRDSQDTWENKPSSYHVVFFDDKHVSRAWIPSSRLRKFDGVKPRVAQTKVGARLEKSFELALKASDECLSVRRRKYCFAAVFRGTWGPVWPWYGEEQSGWDDGPDYMNLETISQDILSQPRDQRNMSFIDKSFTCDLLQSVDDHVPVVAKKSRPESSSNNNSVNDEALDLADDDGKAGPINNVDTVPDAVEPPPQVLSMTFTDDDMMTPSLAREVHQALEVANLFTPVKKTVLNTGAGEVRSVSSPQLVTSTPLRPELSIKSSHDHDTSLIEASTANTSAAFEE